MEKEYQAKTLKYYNESSELFKKDTVNVDFSDIQDKFLTYLEPGSLILDFGCGSGRDSRYFLNKGFKVDAVDGSEEMVKIAREITGLDVKQMLFQELNETEKYDGIFACASILHVAYNELPDVFEKMIRALKNNGILYVSFKYGDFEGEVKGRYFTYLTKEKFGELISRFKELKIVEEYVSCDVRPGRADEKWLNVFLRKNEYGNS